MICYLGYVLLFGVAAPLTPFIVLVFAYIEKYFDKKVEVVYLKERTACLDRLRQI